MIVGETKTIEGKKRSNSGMVGTIAGLAGIGQNLYNTWSQSQTQKKTWAREDSAVQRRVADLKAAGLSPVLAAGGGASSVNTIAPQTNAGSIPREIATLMGSMRDITKTLAETNRVNAETQLKNQEYNYLSLLDQDALRTKKYYQDTRYRTESANTKEQEAEMYNFIKSMGAMSPYMRMLGAILGGK